MGDSKCDSPLGEVLSSVGRGPMRSEEAAYLGAWFSNQAPADLSPLVELGASTQVFHETHPHVENDVLGPLTERGVRIVKTDLQPGPHIDIAGDIYDVAVQAKLKAAGAKCVLCCGAFEHVADREAFARVCDEILSPGGRDRGLRAAELSVAHGSDRHVLPAHARGDRAAISGLHGARPRHRRERHCCWRHGHAVAGCPSDPAGRTLAGEALTPPRPGCTGSFGCSAATDLRRRPSEARGLPSFHGVSRNSMYSPPDQPHVPAPRIAGGSASAPRNRRSSRIGPRFRALLDEESDLRVHLRSTLEPRVPTQRESAASWPSNSSGA